MVKEVPFCDKFWLICDNLSLGSKARKKGRLNILPFRDALSIIATFLPSKPARRSICKYSERI